MNICMVSGDFSYPPYGGVAAHIYELSRSLVTLGHTVHVVKSSYGTQPDLVQEIDGIIIHFLFVSGKIYAFPLMHLILRTGKYIRAKTF